MLRTSTKYQQIIASCFYPSAQAISFLLIAQVVYLNFHYVIGASLTVVAALSLLFQSVMGLAQSLYYEGHQKSQQVDTILKIQFYTNHGFVFAYVGFMIWAAVYMYQHAVT